MTNNICVQLVLNAFFYCIVLSIVLIVYDFRMYFMYPLSILIPPSIDNFKMELLISNNKREIIESTFKELKFISACLIIFGINIIFGFSETMFFKYLSHWNFIECYVSIFTINFASYFIHSYQSKASIQNLDSYDFITVLPLISERTVTHIFGAFICYWILKM